jgi:hypothetical protein
MPGDIPPLPNTPSWRGAKLKRGDKFTLPTWKVQEYLFSDSLSDERWTASNSYPDATFVDGTAGGLVLMAALLVFSG